jgi:perosamine synthetase
MTLRIPLFKIYHDDKDIESVVNIVKRGYSWANGQEIREFEEEIARYIGVKYCTVISSGTSALQAALLAHNIGSGDEVIVPSFTFVATANSPLFVGARPVFADIEEKTYGLNPEDVEKKITSRTKAILCVHYGGCPCYVKELKEIAESHNLLLIEDAAEALGAKIGSEYVGAFGDSAILSFCQNKVITTGEGGAVITNSKEVFERLKLIRSHGRAETQDYFTSAEHPEYVSLGYNFRMSTITAALGLSQIKKINEIIKLRREKAASLTENLSKIKGITVTTPPSGYFHVYQMYTVMTYPGKRDRFMQYLMSKGIMTKVYFDPVHLTFFYRDTLQYRENLPVTERVSKQVVSLPIYPTLQDTDITYMADEIEDFMVRT